jgi:NitT/TauT family transport system substrate-binding protein
MNRREHPRDREMERMMNRRDLLATSAAAFAASALPVQAAEPIQMSTLAGLDYLAPLVAKDAGLFAKQGIDVAVQIATQAPALLPAVIGGALQIGVSTGIQVSIANEAGLDVVIIAGAGMITRQDVTTAVVMRPDANLEKPSDFIGKKVLTPGINGAFHTLFLRYLRLGGVEPQQVTFIEGGFAQMPDLLKAKQVDAVLSAEPFLTRMIDSGVGKRLNYFVPEKDYVFASFYIAKRSWVEAHKAEVEKFRTAMRDAVSLSKSEPAVLNDAVTKYLKLPPDVVKTLKPSDARVDVRREDVQFWSDLALQFQMLRKPVDAASLLL